ncbi:MAG TPA: twin-arginine translocase TatA/TatE family subunit [Candidatus Acidoferrales bacterium]|jgi:TatA/E family protein of Tat protein translocase|nr:twin-arginine translocase TatA/TatE family subunit [Candidatus Acidoferrales bacterium]
MLSIPHLIVIFVVALVVFGPEKLPELARNFGKVMAEFRRATGDLRTTFEGHMRDLEREAETRRTVSPAGTVAPTPPAVATAQPSATGPQPVPSAAPRAVPSAAPDLPPVRADAAAVEAGVIDPMQDPFLAGYDFDVPQSPGLQSEPAGSSPTPKAPEPDEKSPEKVSQK